MVPITSPQPEPLPLLAQGILPRRSNLVRDCSGYGRVSEAMSPRVHRVLQGVYSNTVWAVNQTTITEETLGSGNGTERQALTLLQTPVLEGEKLYVRELEAPSDEERQDLEAMEQRRLGGVLSAQEKDALVQTRDNPLSGEPEIWVRWHRVDAFPQLRCPEPALYAGPDHGCGHLWRWAAGYAPTYRAG